MTELEKLNKEKTEILTKIESKKNEILMDQILIKSKKSLLSNYEKELAIIEQTIEEIK